MTRKRATVYGLLLAVVATEIVILPLSIFFSLPAWSLVPMFIWAMACGIAGPEIIRRRNEPVKLHTDFYIHNPYAFDDPDDDDTY